MLSGYFYFYLSIYEVRKVLSFVSKFVPTEMGRIFAVQDAILSVSGLDQVTTGEMTAAMFRDVLGMVLNLEAKLVRLAVFKDNIMKSGELFKRMYQALNIKADFSLLGTVFNSISFVLNTVDFLNGIFVSIFSKLYGLLIRFVELRAPGIIFRQPVHESFLTGVLGVDCALPLGQGQRELIIGDRQTGKTVIASDSILNQSSLGNKLLTALKMIFSINLLFGVLSRIYIK